MIDIEHDCTLLVEWFRNTFTTLNALKCHLLVAGCKDELMFASAKDALLWEEQSAKLLGILINFSLKWKKASQEITAISRKSNFYVTRESKHFNSKIF